MWFNLNFIDNFTITINLNFSLDFNLNFIDCFTRTNIKDLPGDS